MTKLRREGATQEEVNVYTRHASGSNVVNDFYNNPCELVGEWEELQIIVLDEHEDDVFHGRQLLWGSSRKAGGGMRKDIYNVIYG
ncbi:MAG: hypothetical protein EZS28_023598 [Streblomastix strix]|uniref:Uncharacterized protein n=1 Tax=Streblomastix strix TaxID=222440 RepID=A0A5J4VE71_9EUKA|nr:MAG: hypothetical protein EZS28_023598 [Streblomastix strix]